MQKPADATSKFFSREADSWADNFGAGSLQEWAFRLAAVVLEAEEGVDLRWDPKVYGCTPEDCATTPSWHCCIPWDDDEQDEAVAAYLLAVR